MAAHPKKQIVSRRRFIQTCTAGAVAMTSATVMELATPNAKAKSAAGLAPFSFPLNQGWLFGGEFNSSSGEKHPTDANFSSVTLPHCVVPLSWQNWDPAQWEKTWIYRRHLSLPATFSNRRIFLQFDGVMVSATPAINGTELAKHEGGYLPFSYELTSLLKPSNNVLEIKVDARWQNVPPEGSPRGTAAVDYYAPGGIVRSVSLHAVPQVFISDLFAKPVDVLNPERHVDVLCSIDADASASGSFDLRVELMDGTRVLSRTHKQLTIDKAGKLDMDLKLSDLEDIHLWDVDSPHLYHVVATLSQQGKPLHDFRRRIGFREAKFTVDGFFLNGRRLRLFGLNRHEIYPYVGNAMPARVVRRDAEILRNDFNCNIVRCSHYPQSEAFLDACDELGLMVWEETPGWGYVGDAAFEDLVAANVEDMVRRDRNHTSIVIWGVRVNESRNDQPLYRRTTARAKELDGSRPCSGSMTNFRNWQEEWHEDVFAMDDYHSAPDGTVGIYPPLPGVPYMLSETVGQYSYGGKGFNNVYRRAGDLKLQTAQAINHAQAHDRAAAYPRMCGTIAWCGFEYESPGNSHLGVKNPGVADVFRIPKLGASFYLAQVDPKVRAVIAPDFYWDFGPQSPRGPGKNAAIFSNCERLELFVNGTHQATLHPDRTGFPNLKYPPFFVDLDLERAGNPELRIDGYVRDSLVISKSLSSDTRQDQFLLKADDAELVGDGSDATRLSFYVADKFGAARLMAGGKVNFELTGPAVLVGDNPFDLDPSGGAAAVWIKALPNSSGKIVVKATHSLLGTKSVMIHVRPPAHSDLNL